MPNWTNLTASGTASLLVKMLAIVGGAALGAVAAGLLIQALARLLGGQKVPRGGLIVIRLLGAVTAGWLVALLVLGGSGSGMGGTGGWSLFGTGDGKGAAEKADAKTKDDTANN